MFRRMGFVEVWLSWMDAMVFSSWIPSLVNSSPTKDFSVGRGLRQGDPLSPFLFILVAEGLTMLVRKAASNREFVAFSMEDKRKVDILQFADDMLFFGEGS